MRTQKAAARPKGYTLAELMIIVFIIGVLATIAAPFLLRTLRYSALEGAADDMISTFALARSQAISNNTYCQIRFDMDMGIARVFEYQPETEDWIVTTDPVVLPETITFQEGGVTFPGGVATFDPHGSLIESGSITLLGPMGNTLQLNAILASGRLLRSEEE
mgnify:CR=1 FL=1